MRKSRYTALVSMVLAGAVLSGPAAAHIHHSVGHSEALLGIGSGLFHILTDVGHLAVATVIGALIGMMPLRGRTIGMVTFGLGAVFGFAHAMAMSPLFETGLGMAGLALGITMVMTASALTSRFISGLVRANANGRR